MMKFWLLSLFTALILTTDAAEPVFKAVGNVPGNIQFADAPATINLTFENHGAFAGDLTEMVRVIDFFGNGPAVQERRLTLQNDTVLTNTVTIPPEPKGAFTVIYSLRRGDELIFSRSVNGAVLTPVNQRDPAHSPIGMYCHNVQWNGKNELPILKNMGICWIRANLSWGSSEPQKGQLDFKQSDASYQILTDYQMNIMYNLVYPPRWAVNRVNGYGGNPADYHDYADFAARMAKRYPKVQHWSLWNEPDAESHWEGGGAEYAKMLKTVTPAIKAANPQAKVLPGGVTGSRALSERFMRELNEAGGRPYFDIYEYHYRNVDLHKKLIGQFGWSGMPLWNTESAEGDGKAFQIVRETVSGLAAGVERTFVFLYSIKKTTPADVEEFGPVVMVDDDARPTANFPVIYTMSREINGISDCRKENTGGPMQIYTYRDGDGKTRYIVWGNTPADRAGTFEAAGPVTAVNADGVSVALTPFQNLVSVPVSEVTYLKGAQLKYAGQPLAEIGKPNREAVFGGELEIPLMFHNPAGVPFDGSAILAASPDWEIAQADIPLKLAPGESRQILCRLKARQLADCAQTRLTLTMRQNDGGIAAWDYRDLKLATSLDFTLTPAFRWGQPYVRAAIVNPTAAPVKGTIVFNIPGETDSKSTMPVTLPPLTSSLVYYKVRQNGVNDKADIEAALTYPGGVLRKSAGLSWIAVKAADNPPVVLNRRNDYISPSRILFQWEGPEDLSAVARLGWDQNFLQLTVEVTDDVHSPDNEPGLLWQRDSMQIWFDNMLFDLALTRTGAVLYRHSAASEKMDIRCSVKRAGNLTTYQIKFPKPDGTLWQENDTVKFAFIINDADTGAERKGWLYYLADVGDPRSRQSAPEITLIK